VRSLIQILSKTHIPWQKTAKNSSSRPDENGVGVLCGHLEIWYVFAFGTAPSGAGYQWKEVFFRRERGCRDGQAVWPSRVANRQGSGNRNARKPAGCGFLAVMPSGRWLESSDAQNTHNLSAGSCSQ
jgi:hypothetical protein